MNDRILEAIECVISLCDAEIVARNKVFGPLETYSCQTVNEALRVISRKLDGEEFEELNAIAEFHVGRVITQASKFLRVVRTADLDRETILQEILARPEVALGLID